MKLIPSLVLLSAMACAEEPAPVDVKDWESRDVEARWVLLRSSAAGAETWTRFLKNRRENELLEWMSVTGRETEPLLALAENKAPQWIRCAVWALQNADSHSREGSKKVLMDRPGESLAWLRKHGAKGPAKDLLAELEKLAPASADISALFPPFDEETLLADLLPPKILLELGFGRKAEADKRYVHQVERAIDILTASSLRDLPWSRRLLALTSHASTAVRVKSCLAFSHFPPEKIPFEALLALVEKAGEKKEVREAALLGGSYSGHPSVYARLHRIALNPSHDGWRVAVSRLAETGDGFTLLYLRGATAEEFGPAVVEALEKTSEQIRKRLAGEKGTAPGEIERMLARAAWADIACDPLEATLIPWTLDDIRSRLGVPDVRVALEAIVKTDPAAPEEKRVREYAKRLLEGGK
ncbi:MAG: hypothetical protein FD180_1687 [Planctomycetota bacterium]|nr:MAG: hypothetical protein FD180_1687 [Planctomycetota bacterium]